LTDYLYQDKAIIHSIEEILFPIIQKLEIRLEKANRSEMKMGCFVVEQVDFSTKIIENKVKMNIFPFILMGFLLFFAGFFCKPAAGLYKPRAGLYKPAAGLKIVQFKKYTYECFFATSAT
jgi:hypothetical protein